MNKAVHITLLYIFPHYIIRYSQEPVSIESIPLGLGVKTHGCMALAFVREQEPVTQSKVAEGATKRLLLLIPLKATSSLRPTDDLKVITVLIKVVVSVSKVMDLQRLGMLSSLRELSEFLSIFLCSLCILSLSLTHSLTLSLSYSLSLHLSVYPFIYLMVQVFIPKFCKMWCDVYFILFFFTFIKLI